MDQLSCKTPSMIAKEVEVYLLAYNLIRSMMAQAAALDAGTIPAQISFKHTVQLWRAWRTRGLSFEEADVHALIVLIGERRVGSRPGRVGTARVVHMKILSHRLVPFRRWRSPVRSGRCSVPSTRNALPAGKSSNRSCRPTSPDRITIFAPAFMLVSLRHRACLAA